MEEQLTPFEEALATVMEQPVTCRTETIALADAPGRILAIDVFSDMDMPPFDKSAVDGYACHPDDLHGRPVRVTETIPAGSVPRHAVAPGHCTKVMTGAMIPAGAHRVVMVEDTETAADGHIRILCEGKGSNICRQGEDIRRGARVLEKGSVITPAMVAVLATVGITHPLVAILPSVGVLSTGDELVEPGQLPGPAQIRNSNASQLLAQLRSVPAIPRYYGIVPDAGSTLKTTLEKALEENDLVLLTGGVSMGDFDLVPAVMQDAGVGILFRKVAIQPGKPTVFGRRGDRYLFGLPGNPVSSFVLFEIMVRPFLLKQMGALPAKNTLRLPMGTAYMRKRTDRMGLVPVSIRDGEVFPVEYHGSAHINAYTLANGILEIAPGVAGFNRGENVYVRPL